MIKNLLKKFSSTKEEIVKPDVIAKKIPNSKDSGRKIFFINNSSYDEKFIGEKLEMLDNVLVIYTQAHDWASLEKENLQDIANNYYTKWTVTEVMSENKEKPGLGTTGFWTVKEGYLKALGNQFTGGGVHDERKTIYCQGTYEQYLASLIKDYKTVLVDEASYQEYIERKTYNFSRPPAKKYVEKVELVHDTFYGFNFTGEEPAYCHNTSLHGIIRENNAILRTTKDVREVAFMTLISGIFFKITKEDAELFLPLLEEKRASYKKYL